MPVQLMLSVKIDCIGSNCHIVTVMLICEFLTMYHLYLADYS